MKATQPSIASLERRRFLEISGRWGFSTAVLAGVGGYLWNDQAIAQTGADEEKKQKAAILIQRKMKKFITPFINRVSVNIYDRIIYYKNITKAKFRRLGIHPVRAN